MDKSALKKRIDTEIAKTRQQIEALKEQVKPISPDNAIGRFSRMDAINNKSVNEASLHQARDKLTLLEAALSRIDEPGFGLCIRCGQPIPEGRIMLMPQSRKCVNCA